MNLKRYISLLLAVMLFIGMIPYAQATEVSAAEETVASTEPTTDTTSPNVPTDPPADGVLDGNDIAAYASTQKSMAIPLQSTSWGKSIILAMASGRTAQRGWTI